MKKSLVFAPLDYDYFDWQGRNYIRLIGRDDQGARVCVIDSYEPYFWAILKPKTSDKKIQEIVKKIEKIKVKLPTRTTIVEKTEIRDKNFLGKATKAIKIFVTNYKDAHDVADHIGFKEVIARREYDLGLVTKYISDKKIIPLENYQVQGELLNNSSEFGGIDQGLDVEICIKAEKIEKHESKKVFEPKILAFDIETDELEIGQGEILMISMVSDKFQKVLTCKKCPDSVKYVECFKDEASMIETFIKYTKELEPDLITGYFSDGFDMPYLRARAEANNIKLNLGLDNKQPIFARGRIPSAKITGVIHVDLFRFISTVYSQYLQSETLGLNAVASELLGEKKIDFDHKHSSKLKKQEWLNYFKYNLQDSILTYKLAKKLWPDMLEFSKIIQEPLFNITRASMSQLVESYVIHNLDKYNEIAEKHPVHEEIGKRRERPKYEGAFVLQPEPGLYKNLAMFDFTSYWPSIIVTYNLSASTFSENKKPDHTEVQLANKKVYFSKKPGFFPQMLAEIIEKRKQYKAEYKKNPSNLTKARSNAYKLLANSSYGYQGFFGARYYCPEAGASTTAISRDFTKKIIAQLNKQGYTAVYSDTDSIAITLNKKTKKQALESLKQINSKLPGIMELELEDFYKRGIWVTKRTGEFGAKKKYALVNEQGKIKIRGFETVRRDWCNLARESQNHILKKILIEGTHESSLKYIKEIIKKIRKREIPKQKLIIKTQLKRPLSEYKANTPHIAIARKMQEQGLPLNIGILIEYFIAESKDKKARVRDRAKLQDEKDLYDIEYYINNQILPAVENIFQVFNIDIKEAVQDSKQAKLF